MYYRCRMQEIHHVFAFICKVKTEVKVSTGLVGKG